MTHTERPFRLRSVALAAFLPTLLFSIGEGAIIPIIPMVADNLGATLAIAGLIASMIMIGELVGDIPSGWIVAPHRRAHGDDRRRRPRRSRRPSSAWWRRTRGCSASASSSSASRPPSSPSPGTPS